MAEEQAETQPKPRKRRQNKVVQLAPAPKRRKPTPTVDKEIKAEMKRLGYAVSPVNIDMFKLAIYQVVANKLNEANTLLRLVAPKSTVAGPAVTPLPGATMPQAPRRPMTLEAIDEMERQAAARQAEEPPHVGPKCQLCGRPAVAKNQKGMTVCQGHLPMIEGDHVQALANDMVRRHANRNTDEEVIRVDAGQIAAMAANPQEQ